MVYILGINSFHSDASAVIIKNGEIIFAAEEERFNRQKHWAGFPKQSINWCLKSAGISLKDVDHISINCNPKANFGRKILYSLLKRPNPIYLFQRIKNKQRRLNLESQFKKSFSENFKGNFHFIEHHKCHLASAFYCAPYESSSIVSVDAFGDFASTSWGFGESQNITEFGKIFFPDSLGIFYTAITQFLGFPNFGDEYKVMGLAPYGNDVYKNEMGELIKFDKKGLFKLNQVYFNHTTQKINHEWSNCVPLVPTIFNNKMEDLFGTKRNQNEPLLQRHMDIAKSLQNMYEKAFFKLLNYIYQIKKSNNICIAGGCGANSVANGKIRENTPFKNVYIQPASGDSGGALGAALEVWHKIQTKRCNPMGASYFGPSFSNDQIANYIKNDSITKRLKESNCSVKKLGDLEMKSENNLLEIVVDNLLKGNVVGWFQGKMEWGPRALGNRSILGDPRRNDMKEILNNKIKKRESFRPFAPSILKEHSKYWFETDVEVPYMMQVLRVNEDKRSLIPAVTHHDGSGRLQTVTEESNKRYYKLINLFYEKTSVPILLNTSFNENEPIVCHPKEALDCFLRTKMDLLVIEDFLIQRNTELE